MRASVDGALVDVCELDRVPTDGLVKLLKLTDGHDSKYLAVDDVLDIFTLDGDIAPSAQPDQHEGVVNAFGEAVELINVFKYFEVAQGQRSSSVSNPLCFVDCGEDANWERRILAPLLAASGYQVSFDDADRSDASVVLRCDVDNALDDPDHRVLRLRDTNHVARGTASSIYRYDRVGLISAIEAKLAGGA